MSDIQAAKDKTRAALTILRNSIDNELRNLDRFEDDRMLVATGDLERHYNEAIERCDEFRILYEDWKYSREVA